jgi:hypothetical protein
MGRQLWQLARHEGPDSLVETIWRLRFQVLDLLLGFF